MSTSIADKYVEQVKSTTNMFLIFSILQENFTSFAFFLSKFTARFRGEFPKREQYLEAIHLTHSKG